MNRTLKLAFGAVLGAALVAPVAAQNFPDTQEWDWAFNAILNLKNEGILVGYPDGLFRPGRPASRRELAGALNAAYEKLKGMIGGLQNQIDAINQKIDNMDNFATKAELAALRDQLAQIQRDIQMMKGWGDDIANMKKLVDMLSAELKELGVDVDAMKRDLSDLADRVAKLEARKPAIDIHGDLNFVMHAGHSTDDLFGITVDRRLTGVGRGAYGGDPSLGIPPDPVGMTRDLTMGHEAGFTFSGTNDEGPKWHATIVVGNLMGFGDLEGGGGFFYGNQGHTPYFAAPFNEVNETVYVQSFGVNFDTSVWGQNFTAELGRVGYQAGNYFFKRYDNTPYFDNPRWDDGNWYFDGGILKFNWGSVGLDVYGGRTNQGRTTETTTSVFANNVWLMTAGLQFGLGFGDLEIDQLLGFHLNFGLGDRGDIALNYIYLDSNTFDSFSAYNRVVVWGGELNYAFNDAFSLNGGYSQTNYQENDDVIQDEDNAAYWGQIQYNGNRWGGGVGWRHIDPFFGAPGDWGRQAILWNLTDYEGVFANVWFNMSDRWKLSLDGYSYQGLDGILLNPDYEATGISAMLTYRMNDSWSWLFGVESDRLEVPGSEDLFTWFRVGMTHSMADGSWLKFLYENSHWEEDSTDLNKGGLLTIQWHKKT